MIWTRKVCDKSPERIFLLTDWTIYLRSPLKQTDKNNRTQWAMLPCTSVQWLIAGMHTLSRKPQNILCSDKCVLYENALNKKNTGRFGKYQEMDKTWNRQCRGGELFRMELIMTKSYKGTSNEFVFHHRSFQWHFDVVVSFCVLSKYLIPFERLNTHGAAHIHVHICSICNGKCHTLAVAIPSSTLHPGRHQWGVSTSSHRLTD